MGANGDQLSLHDGVESHGIDGDSRTLGNDDDQGALELEVDEKSNIVGSLLTLGQLSKDKEASPALTTLGDAHTLQDGSKRFKIAFRYTARLHNTQRTEPAVYEEDIGDDDGNGEDPFGDFEWNLGLNLARPFIESEQIDGSEGVGGVDGTGDEDEDPQPNVGKGCETRC